MILEMEIGDSIKTLYAQYYLNENQLINAIVWDFKIELLKELETEGFMCEHWGKLSELNFIMEAQMRNSLNSDNWDFKKYPNPEILIMTRIKNTSILTT